MHMSISSYQLYCSGNKAPMVVDNVYLGVDTFTKKIALILAQTSAIKSAKCQSEKAS